MAKWVRHIWTRAKGLVNAIDWLAKQSEAEVLIEDRLTTEGAQVLAFAREEARGSRSEHVGAPELFIALARFHDIVGLHPAFGRPMLSARSIRDAVDAYRGSPRPSFKPSNPPSRLDLEILGQAMRIALRDGSNMISPTYILGAVVALKDPFITAHLRRARISPESLAGDLNKVTRATIHGELPRGLAGDPEGWTTDVAEGM